MSTFTAKIDPNGTFVFANRTTLQAFGYGSDLIGMNLLGGPWWSFDRNVYERVQSAFEKALQGQSSNYDEKLRVATKEGFRILDINFSMVPIKKNGEVEYILAEGRDITQIKKAQAALLKAQEVAHIGSWEWDLKTGRIMVAPVTVFGEKNIADFETAKVVLKGHNLFKRFGLLDVRGHHADHVVKKEAHDDQEEHEHSIGVRQYILLFISLLLVCFSILFALVQYDVIDLPWQVMPPTKVVLQQDKSTNAATEAGALEEVSISQFSTRIDYTSIDSANQVKQILEEMGFTTIDLVELEDAGESDVTVTFESEIPESMQEEVRSRLEEVFESVEEIDSELPENVDMHITVNE